ncbi:MAG: zf-HC2 domain-containing protein [Phycisphaerae bacterium]|nr:zf-HC2 domain-containing protein [Phycisphaerae bacterium]
MSNHNEIKDLLAAYALGDLSPDQAKIVAEHIAKCQSCKQELESMRLVLDCAGQMSKVSVDDDMYVSAKEGLLSSLSPEKTQTQPAKTAKTIQWRTIMQTKVTKFATAAVIILGVFLGMYMLGISPDGSSVAWASLAERVQQIKTVRYKMHMTMKGLPGLPKDKVMEMDQTIMTSSEYGMKMEMSMDGKLASRIYMLFDEESMVSIMPEQKQYMRITLTDELREKTQKESYDPKKMVADFMELDYVELGRKEIDGVEVEGIEVNDPKLAAGMFPDCIGRLWVDVETNLPVQMEIDFGGKNDMEMKAVIDRFEWDIEIDESEFAYVIPDDYKEMANFVMPEMNADTAIEGLKTLIPLNDGKFPKTLSMMDVITDVSKRSGKQLAEKMKARNKAIEEAKAAGIDPNTLPEVQENTMEKLQERMVAEMMKIQGICMFYATLISEKKDPAYYGDRVTPADKDMILMRWLNDKDGYTVIFADLSTGDFTVEEVVEMELQLPEPPAEVKEVHDHSQDHSHDDHPEHPPAIAPVEAQAVAPAE